MQQYILSNPDQADNIEDMLNWTCEKFAIDDGPIVDEILRFIAIQTNLT